MKTASSAKITVKKTRTRYRVRVGNDKYVFKDKHKMVEFLNEAKASRP